MVDHVYYLDVTCCTDRDYVLDRRIARAPGQSAEHLAHASARSDVCGVVKQDNSTLCVQGILLGEARQHLGQLVFYVFVPCLTFTKLASSVDLNNLAVWWPLPVNTALR